MNRPKIVITIKNGRVREVMSNILNDIEVEISYLDENSWMENLDSEIERKQNGFRSLT